MQKLSKREKVMLYVLMLVALITLAVLFTVQPILNNYNDALQQADDITLLRQNTEMKIARLPAVKKTVEEYKEEIVGVRPYLAAKMSDDAIVQYFTDIIASTGMTPTSVLISDPVMEQLGNFEKDASAAKATVNSVKTNLSAFGTTGQLLKLIDEIYNTKYLEILDITAGDIGGEAKVYTITLTLNMDTE